MVSESNTDWARKALRDSINESQLSVSDYSHQILKREPSTVYRYLRGSPIPAVVQRFLLGDFRILDTDKGKNND